MKVTNCVGNNIIYQSKDIFNAGSSHLRWLRLIPTSTTYEFKFPWSAVVPLLHMCLWLLTACLGLLPTNPSRSNVIVVQGVPAPIIQPTTVATTTAATMMVTNMTRPPGNPSMQPPPPGSSSTSTTTTIRPTITTSSTTTPRPGGTTGPLPIDPRLGSPPPPSGQMQIPQIMGFNAQAPSFENSVRFPREKRSTDPTIMKQVLYNFNNGINKNHRRAKRQSCTCVTAGTCFGNTVNNGAGQIDVRIVTIDSNTGICPAGQEYCCSGTTSQVACGVLQATPAVAVIPQAGQSNYGEYPWQVNESDNGNTLLPWPSSAALPDDGDGDTHHGVRQCSVTYKSWTTDDGNAALDGHGSNALILTRQNDYIAGGVLIDQFNVLTVTHRLTNYVVSGTAPNVKVRLGEWDAAGSYEPVPYQEYTIQRATSHPSYNPNTLQYDITILRLSRPVPLTPEVGAAVTINRACLPPSSSSTYVGQRCWVSGWGKDVFGVQGEYQQILKEVDVPIVASATCQSQMQAARLGPNFVLDTTSFICAGGEANKDSCTGDGGSGLVCSVNGQWVVVGLVSWGLGCANANVPAAYVNVAALLPWIQQQVAAA